MDEYALIGHYSGYKQLLYMECILTTIPPLPPYFIILMTFVLWLYMTCCVGKYNRCSPKRFTLSITHQGQEPMYVAAQFHADTHVSSWWW